MQNIAEIGFKAKTDQLADAKKKLDDVADAAKKTETATEKLERKLGPLGGAFSKVSASVNDASSAFGKLAAVIGGVLASAIAGFSLQKFITSTSEADKVTAQLNSVLKSTGGVAGQTLQTLNAHASALQKVTTYGDDTIKGAQELLLTFTRISSDAFPRATEAVLDYATRMRVDLKGAAIAVGKALNDPAIGMTALSKAGVTFSESQKTAVKAMMETGDLAGAQKIIFGELETQMQGSAKAARETLGGAITALGEAWGDLFELGPSASEPLRLAIEGLNDAFSNEAFLNFVQGIGGLLFGAATLAVQGVTLLIGGINILSANFDTLAVAAGAAGAIALLYFAPAILAGMATGFAAVGAAGVAAFRAIGVAIAANPIGALATALVGVITAAYYFRDKVNEIFGVDVVQAAKNAANFLINSFIVAYEDIKFIFSNIGSAVAAAILGAINAVISGVDRMIKQAASGVNILIGLLNKIPGSNISQIDTSGDFLKPIDNPYASSLESAAAARASYRTILMAADNFAGGSTPKPAGGGVAPPPVPPPPGGSGAGSGQGKGGAAAAMTSELEKLKTALDALMEPFSQAKSAFESADKALKAGVITSDEYGKKIAEIEAAFLKAGGSSEQFAKITNKNIYDVNAKLGEMVKDSLTKLGDAFIDLALSGKASFSDLTKSIVKDLLKIMWQALIVQPLLNSLFGKNGFFPGIGVPSATSAMPVQIVPFADGGVFTNSIVTKPTAFGFANGGAFGVMGEAGPEAVMPLQRGPDGSLGVQMYGGANDNSGGPNVYIEIINNTPDSEIKRERSQNSDGSMMERIIIDTVARGMAEGKFDKVQSARFGNRTQKTFR
jgi:hypothetical protein